jgi:hypothetical protein
VAEVTDPFGLSVSPFRTTAAAGDRTAVVHATVRDVGTKPIEVTTAVRQLSGMQHGCGLAAVASWAKATPATFALKPGEAEHVTVSVTAPPAVTGHVDLAAMFTGQLPHQTGAVAVTGAVGSRVELSLPGATTGHPCSAATAAPKAAPLPPAGNGGAGTGALVIFFALLACVAAVVTWAVRSVRKHRRL